MNNALFSYPVLTFILVTATLIKLTLTQTYIPSLPSITKDLVMQPDGTTYSGSFQPGMSEAITPGPHNPPRLGYIIKTTPNDESHYACHLGGPDGRDLFL